MSTWVRRRSCVAILMVGPLLLCGIARSDTLAERQILGTWLTQDREGKVQIFLAASGKLEGRILDDSGGPAQLDEKNPDPAVRTRPLNGAVILQGFRYAGNGKWIDGSIYDPDSGKTYRCTMDLKDADTLSVRGYIGLPAFGRSVQWTRVKPQ